MRIWSPKNHGTMGSVGGKYGCCTGSYGKVCVAGYDPFFLTKNELLQGDFR